MKMINSQFRVVGSVLDLLGERVLIAAHAGADSIHALHSGEVKAFLCYKINRDSDFKVFVQVLEIVQHVRALHQKINNIS